MFTLLAVAASLTTTVAATSGFPETCPIILSAQRDNDTTIGICESDFDVVGGDLEAVYEGARAPTGIAVDPDLNIFFTYARNMEVQNYTLTKATSLTSEVPWPSEEWQNCNDGQNASECFVNVQNVVLDAENVFWVIDSGVPNGESFPTTYGPKIMAFNITTGEVIRSYIYPEDQYNVKLQLNDIKINNTLGHAFITEDSQYGSITTLNLETGVFNRRLFNSTVTKCDEHFTSTYNGSPIRGWKGTTWSYLNSGTNGIALTGGRVYWGVKASHRYHYATQEALISASDDELLASVQTLDFPSEGAGFTADDRGRVYMTASQHNAILYVDTLQSETTEEVNGVAPGGEGLVPTENHILHTLVRSGLVQAADTAAIYDGYLYFSTNQQGLAPARQWNNIDKRKGPFRSYRTYIGRGPAV